MFASNEVPGPGAYNDNNDKSKVSRKVKDNRSGNFKSTAPRFAPNCPGANAFNYPSSYANPGPADYSINGTQAVFKKKIKKIRPSGRTYSERKGNAKTTPSIPSHPISKDGFTGKVNDSVGPNQYKPSYDYISSRPKGLSFSRMSLHNSNIRNKNTKKPPPGPGQYSFELPTKKNFNSNVKGYV